MKKIEFLKLLDEILTREYLKEEERVRIKTIKENATKLPEEISADLLIEKLALITIKGVTSEDGYFKEFININKNDQESQTEIFYLIKGNQVSCLHALETTETWTWLGGKEISIYIFNNQKPIEVITLNENYLEHTIEKGAFFGAKIKNLTNEKDFGLVTCLCRPGFDVQKHYKNPSSEQLANLCKIHPNYEKVIRELTPKNNKNIIQSLIQFFTCCIGVKNEEQAPMINTSQNNR